MTKNTTSQDFNKTITHLCFSKKSNNFNPLQPFLGVIGFISVTSLFIGSFSYLDYGAVLHPGFSLLGLGGTTTLSSSPSEAKAAVANAPANVNERLGFLDEGGDTSDIYDGKWVWDDNYPLYQSQDCPFVDRDYRCLENGRQDSYYTKWRWQPHGCDLPRFNATMMLEKLRNRRLAFIGDSIARTQWESMLCMLATGVPNKDSIYEVNGNPITRQKGLLVFRFEDYNCTVEFYRAPFLVVQGSPPKGSPKDVRMTLKLDQMTWIHHLKDADVLVFNSGRWWRPEKTYDIGCYFQEGMEVKMKMDLTTAFQKSIETLVDFVASRVDTKKTLAILRSYAPVHFRDGDYKTGGHCDELKLPDFGPFPNNTEKLLDIASGVLSKHPQGFQVIKLMNVTPMSYQRQDGHVSLYHLGHDPRHHQDCSHWCLPGVPDSWNELLYALVLQRESSRSQSSQVSL